MKFLVDAQLPLRLARLLQAAGYDAIHTKDLPQQNATPDVEINAVSIQQSRIVITKDTDFFDSFLIVKNHTSCCKSLQATSQTRNLRHYF